ncbi:hypothetical protein D3C87_1911180 [compost metagenome]
MHAGEHFDQGGFARAILPKQGQHAAGFYLQVDPIDRQGSAKTLADIFVIQERQSCRLQ